MVSCRFLFEISNIQLNFFITSYSYQLRLPKWWRGSLFPCSVVDFYRPQTKFAKVMFLHLFVSHSVHRGGACMVAGGHAWLQGACMVGRECVLAGGHAWLWGGACMVAEGACMVAGGGHGCRGHAWLWGGMHGCRGGMHGCKGGMCGCRGHACLWAAMCGCGGHVWLQGVCMVVGEGGMHGCRGACIGYDEIRSMSGQ